MQSPVAATPPADASLEGLIVFGIGALLACALLLWWTLSSPSDDVSDD